MLVPAIEISSDHNQTFSAPKQGEKNTHRSASTFSKAPNFLFTIFTVVVIE